MIIVDGKRVPQTREEILLCRDAAYRTLTRYGFAEEAKRRVPAELYPLPKKVVPRMATYEDGKYKVEGRKIWFRDHYGTWIPSVLSPAKVELLHDLLTNPTEEVEDDGIN